MREKLVSIQADVDSVGTRMLNLEAQQQEAAGKFKLLEDTTADIHKQLRNSLLKGEDLENRSRRDNKRVQGLEEDSEGPDSEEFMVGLFSSALGEDGPEVRLERVHKVGPRLPGGKWRPRAVLAKGDKGRKITIRSKLNEVAEEPKKANFRGSVWVKVRRIRSLIRMRKWKKTFADLSMHTMQIVTSGHAREHASLSSPRQLCTSEHAQGGNSTLCI